MYIHTFCGSYIGAVTEIITGREKDLCSTYEAANPGFTSSGKAKENMGTANMDIIRSELACERRFKKIKCR